LLSCCASFSLFFPLPFEVKLMKEEGHSLSYGFYDMAWTPLAYSYSTEVLPFSMRASGMAAFVWVHKFSFFSLTLSSSLPLPAQMQNATLCINQWVNPIALEAAGWKVRLRFLSFLFLPTCPLTSCFWIP
jgi:hypothetical protein